MASATTSSASSYISAVSMCVMPRSTPRRSAAIALLRSPRSIYQVPCPITDTCAPVLPNSFCLKSSSQIFSKRTIPSLIVLAGASEASGPSFRDGALAPDPESRDSGLIAARCPGMTVMDCFVAEPVIGGAFARPVGSSQRRRFKLIGRGQLSLLAPRGPRLRDQPLQFGNARAAIGPRVDPQPEFGGGARTRRDGVADRGAADAKTGANDGTGARKPIHRFARQQCPSLIVAERARSEQLFDHVPIARIARGA